MILSYSLKLSQESMQSSRIALKVAQLDHSWRIGVTKSLILEQCRIVSAHAVSL